MNGKFAANRCGCIFARRVAFAALCLAFAIDLVMLKLGLGNDGWDWAFRMPDIVKAGIVGLTFSIVGIFISILQLIKRRERDVATWFLLVGTIGTGLGAVFLIWLSIAANMSI